MKALTIVTATALVALGTAPALAQPGGERFGRSSSFQGLDRADREALFDAQMAAIPVALRLSAEQRALWNPVEQSLRAFMADRLNRQEERRRREEAALGAERQTAPAESAPGQPSPAQPGPAQPQAAPPSPAPQGSTGQAPSTPPAAQPPRDQAQAAPQAGSAPMAEAARPQPTDRWLEEIEARSQRLAQSAERVRAFSAAMRPFWASLDDRQRRLLNIVMRWPRGLGPHALETVGPPHDEGWRHGGEWGGRERFGRDRRGGYDDEERPYGRGFGYEGGRDRFSDRRGEDRRPPRGDDGFGYGPDWEEDGPGRY